MRRIVENTLLGVVLQISACEITRFTNHSYKLVEQYHMNCITDKKANSQTRKFDKKVLTIVDIIYPILFFKKADCIEYIDKKMNTNQLSVECNLAITFLSELTSTILDNQLTTIDAKRLLKDVYSYMFLATCKENMQLATCELHQVLKVAFTIVYYSNSYDEAMNQVSTIKANKKVLHNLKQAVSILAAMFLRLDSRLYPINECNFVDIKTLAKYCVLHRSI